MRFSSRANSNTGCYVSVLAKRSTRSLCRNQVRFLSSGRIVAYTEVCQIFALQALFSLAVFH